MDDLTPGQEEAVAATVGAIQRIAMARVRSLGSAPHHDRGNGPDDGPQSRSRKPTAWLGI